jgi:soluble lytic murein transglycosylase
MNILNLKHIHFSFLCLLVLLCLVGCERSRPEATPTVTAWLSASSTDNAAQKSPTRQATAKKAQEISPTSTPSATATSSVEPTQPLSATSTIINTPTPQISPTPLPLTVLQKARQAERIGDWDSAFSLYESLRDDPQDAHAALFYLGNLYWRDDRVVEAMEMWQEAIALEPVGRFAEPSRYRVANQLWQSAEYQRALALYEQFDESNDDADSFMAQKLADLYLFFGQEEKAVAQWMRLYNHPATLRVTQALTAKKIGDWDAQNERWQDALSWYEQTLERSEIDSFRAELMAQMADFALELDDEASAREQWRLLVNLYPEEAEALAAAEALAERGEKLTRLKMGKLYLTNGAWDGAVDAFYEALDEEEDSADTHDLAARAYVGAGNYYAAQVEWQKILDQHQEATTLHDNALLELGRVQAKRGEIESALERWQQVVQDYPESDAAPLALWERTEWLYDSYGDSDVSAAAFMEFAKQYPDDENAANALWEAGQYWYRQGDGENAQRAFAQLADGDSERPTQAFFWAGKAAALAGDNQAAKAFWQQAIEVQQEDYYALRAADWLNAQPWRPRADSSEQLTHPPLDEQLKWLDEAQSAIPNLYALPEEPLLTQGYMLLLMGERDAAFRSIVAAIRAHRDSPQALWAMAVDLRSNDVNNYSLLAAERLIELLGYTPFTAPPELAEFAFPLPFEEQLRQNAEEWNYDPLFFAAMIFQESRWEPRARSHAAARGLTQIIPSTAELIAEGLKDDTFRYEDLDRPLISLHYGSYFLDFLLNRFDDNPFHALAGYNGGPGNARRWMSADDDLFVENISLRETRNYVEWVYEHWHAYQHIYRGER